MNPRAQTAGRPAGLAPEHDPQAWALASQTRGPRQVHQGPQQAFTPPYPPHAETQADPFAQSQAYHYPQQADPFAPAQQQNPANYAPQFDPYRQGHPGELPPQTHDQWQGQNRQPGFEQGYDTAGHFHAAAYPPAGEWGGQQFGQEPGFDPNYNNQGQAGFDQTYAEDDASYEVAAPRKGRKIAMVLSAFVLAGGGLAYAYTALIGSGPDGTPPVVKSAEGPFKVKPSDPGGKQFAHADSKVMGRLGEGGAADSGQDANGVRRVPILAVGRDGTIQPPAPAADQASAPVSVPGMTVIDGFGGSGAAPVTTTRATPAAAPPEPTKIITASEPAEPAAAAPAQAEPKKPTKIATAAASTTLSDAASPTPEPEVKKAAPAKKQVTAALNPAPAATGPQPTGAGYVAVLASVPVSGKSRMDALKQFADMQQKYGALLQNKTPDVQEANLGEKGTYHRLLVGPPGSRDAASSLCTQLKEQGYSGCWVTAY